MLPASENADAASASPLYPLLSNGLPGQELGEGAYRVRFARNDAELDEVLRLRFDVFNRELGEGQGPAQEAGRDEDEFDRFCHHLLVEDRGTGRIVGTYRLQTEDMARRGIGFHAATRFDLTPVPEDILRQGVEIGRACIAREHRRQPVLFLLWKGLALYLSCNQKRYLFGSCPLPEKEPGSGLRALEQLRRCGKLHPAMRLSPLPGLECAGTPEAGAVELPELLETYLLYGGKVCGPPAIDRRLRTVDFLVLLDVHAMDSASYRMFFG